jgi:DNA repair protein RecO (recombination protein O)
VLRRGRVAWTWRCGRRGNRYTSRMPLLQTDAVVLHVATYLESSLILRLATREAGVQSVVARGARSSRKRFGNALDLFAEGQAQIQTKPGRDLHALNGFDVTRARPAIGADLGRFTAASGMAECVLRLVHEEAAPSVYDTLVRGFDRLAGAPPEETIGVALGALWQLVGEVGFRPVIDRCAECHGALDPSADVRFLGAVGGALCVPCARLAPGGRLLPPAARVAITRWLDGESVTLEPVEARAHQRLLREFLALHLPDNRPLKAFQVWEQGRW